MDLAFVAARGYRVCFQSAQNRDGSSDLPISQLADLRHNPAFRKCYCHVGDRTLVREAGSTLVAIDTIENYSANST